ncbi:hypothetical protein [Rhizobium leguminosarum]|uniref:hypothetical protein n=1 Tax=Rhizobium leguminosarum TaxID=384 RepID=UPI0011AB7786|nr:hypothetical protein [Rhizobium leguminosarum]
MNADQAKLLFEAWAKKLNGRTPTAEEKRIIDRYQAIAEWRDPDQMPYDPTQAGDTDEDL